jgi:hypothetical protein
MDNRLGISYSNLVSHVNSNGQRVSSSPLKGITNDVIGNGISGTCNNNYYDKLALTGSNSVISLYFDNDMTVPALIRYDGGSGKRLVYLDFNLSDISSTSIQAKVLSNSMDFLLNGVNSVKTSDNADVMSVANYPNPANDQTTITYSITEHAPVSLVVNDVMGREVARLVSGENEDAGTYSAALNVGKLATGSYQITLTAGGKTVTRTLNVVK